MRESQRPTRREGSPHDDYVEEHPAYAIIGASRVTGKRHLFGSDFVHDGFITIRIKQASLRRGLSQDWIHGTGKELIEVSLSYAQWATFLSTPNHGDGVACTLEWFDGYVPYIEPDTNRREQLQAEVVQTVKDAIAEIDDVLATASLNKAARAKLEHAKTELRANLPFVAKQFDEHAEQTIERGKIELESYLTTMVQRAGIKSLGGEIPSLELAEGGESE